MSPQSSENPTNRIAVLRGRLTFFPRSARLPVGPVAGLVPPACDGTGPGHVARYQISVDFARPTNPLGWRVGAEFARTKFRLLQRIHYNLSLD